MEGIKKTKKNGLDRDTPSIFLLFHVFISLLLYNYVSFFFSYFSLSKAPKRGVIDKANILSKLTDPRKY
jgi:hypothetical protein